MDINAAIRNYVLAVVLLFVFKIAVGDEILQSSKHNSLRSDEGNIEEVEISE